MGTLETPQDRHGYIHRTGPPEWNKQTEAKVEQGAQEAKAVVHGGRGLVPRPGHNSRDLCTPPQKITMGQLRGTRSPPGLNTHKQLKRPWSLIGQIRPRPAGLSIRQRPAGDTMIGWLDNNGSSRLA